MLTSNRDEGLGLGVSGWSQEREFLIALCVQGLLVIFCLWAKIALLGWMVPALALILKQVILGNLI